MAHEFEARFIGKHQATMVDYEGQLRQVLGPCWLVYGEDERGPTVYNPILFMKYFSPHDPTAWRAWHRCVDEVYDDNVQYVYE